MLWQNERLDALIKELGIGWAASRNHPQHQLMSAITYKRISITVRKMKGKTYAQNTDMQLGKKQ